MGVVPNVPRVPVQCSYPPCVLSEVPYLPREQCHREVKCSRARRRRLLLGLPPVILLPGARVNMAVVLIVVAAIIPVTDGVSIGVTLVDGKDDSAINFATEITPHNEDMCKRQCGQGEADSLIVSVSP